MDTSLAHKIADDLLDKTRLEIFGGTRAVFARSFHVPQVVETFSGNRQLTSTADLLQLHDLLCEHFELRGVTDRVRQVLAAEFKSPTLIHSTHESRLIRQGTLLEGPFAAFSLLLKTDEGWKVADSTYAISGEDEHATVLTGVR